MTIAPAVHDTFVITRTYPQAPAQVFAAFADPAKKRRWFSEKAETFEMDFRVGGVELSRARLGEQTPFPGVAMTSEGQYLDIVSGSRIVIAATMDIGERRISAALHTCEFRAVEASTEVLFTHQAAFFEGADGPKMRQGGWVALFEQLGKVLAS